MRATTRSFMVMATTALGLAVMPPAFSAQYRCLDHATEQGHQGTSGPDHYIGDETVNVMAGDEGNDTLEGRGATDFLCGNTDNDSILGEAGDDEINAGDNADTRGIEGGSGTDIIRGGDYGDDLQGNGHADYVGGDNGPDTIRGNGGDDALMDGGSQHTDAMYGGSGGDIFWLCPDQTTDDFPDFTPSEGDQKVHLSDDPNDANYWWYQEWCT